ncbi:MAG: methyltransferase domain-containing protein [Chlamydiales bacterium]|nr:methyltransferase domain-containing protein [Chlamydiales bacterium]
MSETLTSVSENNGIGAMTADDQNIYSVGISTGGSAEIRMAQANPNSHIIATTIDQEGAAFAQGRIEAAGLQNRIQVKIEDISQSLIYLDGYFNFIYARLVLHYLPSAALELALMELHRVLKPGGRIFVVVRSDECREASAKESMFDPETGITTYRSGNNSYSRYFHSEASIQNFLTNAGFEVKYVRSYSERLCSDFQRTQLAQSVDILVELLAQKLS